MRCARNFSLEINFCAHFFFHHHHNQKLRIITMADDNYTDNFIANIKGPSIASSGVQPFCVPVHLIDKNTTIDADFAWKYCQYHQYIDLTVITCTCGSLQPSRKIPVPFCKCIYQSFFLPSS